MEIDLSPPLLLRFKLGSLPIGLMEIPPQPMRTYPGRPCGMRVGQIGGSSTLRLEATCRHGLLALKHCLLVGTASECYASVAPTPRSAPTSQTGMSGRSSLSPGLMNTLRKLQSWVDEDHGVARHCKVWAECMGRNTLAIVDLGIKWPENLPVSFCGRFSFHVLEFAFGEYCSMGRCRSGRVPMLA